jgi:cytochrome oxidase assembly protein ShyY1
MLKPRWLGLLGVLVVLLVAFTVLGLWQLSVARDDARREALAQAPTQAAVALDQVLRPHTAFPAEASGRPVTMTGTYDASGQVLVVDRRLDGTSGSWVVTPLVVDGSGARIAVLRGFVPDESGRGPAPASAAPLTVTGTLAPSESRRARRCRLASWDRSTWPGWSTSGPASSTTRSSSPPPSRPT